MTSLLNATLVAVLVMNLFALVAKPLLQILDAVVVRGVPAVVVDGLQEHEGHAELLARRLGAWRAKAQGEQAEGGQGQQGGGEFLQAHGRLRRRC